MTTEQSISATLQARHSTPRWRWLLVFGAVALLLGLAVWQLRDGEQVVRAADLWFGTVKQGEFSVRLRGSGQVRPGGEAVLSTTEGGIVERMVKLPGERVSAGDALIVLGNSALEQELSRARINRQQAMLEKKETTLNNLSERARALEAIRLAEDKLELSAIETRAKEDLFQRHIISRLDYDKQRIAHQQAQRALESARQRLSEQLQPLWQARLALADARVSKSQLALDELKRRQQQLTLRANVDGTVVRYQPAVKIGARLNSGSEVGLVTDLSHLIVQLKLPAQRVESLEPGMPVRLSNAFGEFSGRIQQVFPSAENGRITIWVSLDKPYPKGLKLGMSVSGEVQLDRFDSVLSVPRPAGVSDGQTATVYVRRGNRLEPRQVQFGKGSADEIIVLQGLEAGDEILLSDSSHLDPSKAVTLTD
jgi:multidrug efflux pump subunit AcrA (membrane-fusion protein)